MLITQLGRNEVAVIVNPKLAEVRFPGFNNVVISIIGDGGKTTSIEFLQTKNFNNRINLDKMGLEEIAKAAQNIVNVLNNEVVFNSDLLNAIESAAVNG